MATPTAVEAAPDLELVHPAGVDGGEVPPQRPQRDLLADDDEVRLVAIHPCIPSLRCASAGVRVVMNVRDARWFRRGDGEALSLPRER